MNRKKRIIITFLFVVVFTFSCNFINNSISFNKNFDLNCKEDNSFQTSDNGFSIVYPENKTYTEPMGGYYPATYGFENDEDGSDPAGWYVFEGAGYVNVRDEINNHKKVVEMYDNTNANHDELHNVFPLQTFGTVEFWAMSNDVSDAFSIRLLDDTATSVWGNGIGWLQFYQDYIRYQDNTSTNYNVKPVIDNTWYHIKIEFECSTGNYQGLAKDTWRFYIDGEEFGDFGFLNDIDNVTQLYFFTRGANYNYRYYVDAVGFSWDAGYNIGDNSQEGLLCSFDTTFTPDWLGCSLDDSTNKTILGNATLPLPANGVHNIQVFGNDSLGTMHASNLRYFTLDVPIISVITPENKTYTGPISGYYPATYGFEEDQIGTSGTHIKFIDSKEAGAVATIVAEADSHKNILRYYTPSDFEAIWDDLSENQSTGTVEFWINCAETNERHGLIIKGPLGNRILFDFYSNGMVQYLSYSVWYPICSYVANRWYHVRVTFDCDIYGDGTNDWHLWIDGVNMDGGVGYGYDGAPMKMDQVVFQGTSGANFDIDAIGYSWDPEYNIGDNFNEGLLLSFKNRTSLVWMGYSLDGLPNKTILGDSTLPLPSNGTHNIQVFGNDTLGIMYASNLRHFTIDIPDINIFTPENKTYTAPMSGYYSATYGFENDEDVSDPAGWNVFEGAGYVNVIDEINNHKKVVEMYDNTNANHDELHNVFPLQTYGTIEFWVMSDDVSDTFSIRLLDDTATSVWGNGIGWLQFYQDYIRYQDNTSTNHNVKHVNDNIWYHIKIEFECSTGNYQGLAQDTWRFYIDGEKFGDFGFLNDINNVNQLYFFTRGADNNYRYYVDAVGFSWDTGYAIGDNSQEGLLLSFDTAFTPDWLGYSLEGLANKTTLGNTTIPFLGDGSHSIQVFGNDTLGTKYESEVRYFSINAPPPSISIITPSNDGYYSNVAPSFSILITAFSQITTWYTLDDDGMNITFTGSSGNINQTEWDSQGEGPVTIRFYVNDSFGRFNYAEITLNKDITDPVIIINSPLFGDQFTTMPPRFNISVDELNINVMWYTIDDGLTTYNILEFTGYIDSGAWNAAPNGAITIRFYVRDKAGNEDSEEVIIQKSAPPYIPPDNSLIIILSVVIGVSIAVFCIVLVVILIRKKRYGAYKFKEPKKPEIHVTPKLGYLICPYCHNKNLIKNRYCINCGASLLEFKPDNI